MAAQVVALLVMVTKKNNNKFYNMRLSGDILYTEHGRIGAGDTRSHTYPASKWDSLYRSKIRKGYVDQTELFAKIETNDFAALTNSEVSTIVNQLQAMAKGLVNKTYLVSSEQVTPQQIKQAQKILDELSQQSISLMGEEANEILLRLFAVIPRKMKNVADHLLKPDDYTRWMDTLNHIILNEQSSLDAMASQVHTNEVATQTPEDEKKQRTVLEALGLKMSPASAADIDLIKKNLSAESADKFAGAWVVENNATNKAFKAHVKAQSETRRDTTLFWHGSRNENWWGILSSGLVLRPTNAVRTGSMFGHGLYFADRARKSIGYTSLTGSYWAGGNQSTGFMGLFEVHLGKPKVVTQSNSRLNASNLGDFDSVFAKKGVSLYNNEYIVYREAQTTIRYLVQLK